MATEKIVFKKGKTYSVDDLANLTAMVTQRSEGSDFEFVPKVSFTITLRETR